MSAPVLTSEDRDAMAHCIGHHSAKGCSVHGGRNHFVTRADDPAWCALVIRGLVVSRESSLLPDGEAVFSGQARYKAARDVAEAWNCTTHEAMKMIESCRMGCL